MSSDLQSQRSYRLDLTYLGTPFQGWQSQPNGMGVQDHLQRALATFLRHDVRLTGASRTDSGVHAQHQVATFRSAVPFDGDRWLASLDGLLPSEIGVARVLPVAEDFHPIRDARLKAYRYRLWCHRRRDPFLQDLVWTVPLRGDTQELRCLRRAGQDLVGCHDFSSFAASDGGAKTTVRHLHGFHVRQEGSLVELWFCGDGFLKQMVRNMVGTLVAAALGKEGASSIATILAARDRRQAFDTAPACGLTLMRIFYGTEPWVAVKPQWLMADG